MLMLLLLLPAIICHMGVRGRPNPHLEAQREDRNAWVMNTYSNREEAIGEEGSEANVDTERDYEKIKEEDCGTEHVPENPKQPQDNEDSVADNISCKN
ncbi:hypothetical protein MATL_G00212810 [Megalops atlanticus]|uniref:Uncharacterized protein n=1 Tax=Megalops atlanticus TaxID=7932 RepID=A0A9D3SXM8_MEGAT|nr:hypothetical protein MATL_G00212810 [Megalops atlanticus]